MKQHFLSKQSLLEGGPKGLLRSTQRLLLHIGFNDVRIIDGANDHGADILAAKDGIKWVIQCKWTSGKLIDETGVNDCERSKTFYGAEKALLVTNATLSPTALKRRQNLEALGLKMLVWDGPQLEAIWELRMTDKPVNRSSLRDYQVQARDSIVESLEDSGKALLVLATALGKTVIASGVIEHYLALGKSNVLVLAHLTELVEQLEKSIWSVLPKSVNTQVLYANSKPQSLEGLTVATPDSMAVFDGYDYQPDVIIIDESHHVSEHGMYSGIIQRWTNAKLLGLTATPWRGDKFDIEAAFGSPAFSMGIAEGMAKGWLSNVDYRIFADNIDWDYVSGASKHGYSIKDLNRNLFLPERDEVIIRHLHEAWLKTPHPQAIVFCATIEHAKDFAEQLQRAEPAWMRTQTIHSEMPKRERDIVLNNFRIGRVPIITCVDIFNEGVDVPDVSIICFLRVTHSRRIFVQQLGRGLRLSAKKDTLRVLDFVTDIRRVAAAGEFRRQLEAETEHMQLGSQSIIQFNDETSGMLLDHWLRDAADLESAHDEVILNFPDPRAEI